MRIVTTCHKAGWEQYGTKFDTDNLPFNHEIRWYTEGFDHPWLAPPWLVRNEDLPKLQAFKQKHAHYIPPDWRFDVVRFANKAYALYDALYDHDGIGVWMDADIVIHEPIPEGYLESLLPQGCYIALFQREGWHSETGLFVIDCAHPQHKRFMDLYIANYETGKFAEAHEWHDCVMLDRTINAFLRDDLIQVHNLSGPHSNEQHPMAKHPISRYLDHLKGPSRKKLGHSPERVA